MNWSALVIVLLHALGFVAGGAQVAGGLSKTDPGLSDEALWKPALRSLEQTTSLGSYARSEFVEVQDASVARLFRKTKLRIFRANHWFKPRPGPQPYSIQVTYILLPGDERIYKFFDVGDLVDLARKARLTLSNEEEVKAFSRMVCAPQEVVSLGQGKWRLTDYGSGIPVKSVRTLFLDDEGLPLSVSEPVRIQWR